MSLIDDFPVHVVTRSAGVSVPKVRAFVDFAVPRFAWGQFAGLAADAGT